MSRYLMKYKGQYRIKPNIDLSANDFPRDENENIDPSYDDIYIKCASGSQIYHYGRSTLVAYIPSIGRGHNTLMDIAKALNLMEAESNNRDYAALYKLLESDGTVFDIVENDEEIEFKFNAKHIELITQFLKPQVSGADISPFSTKNLPKNSYPIPVDEINEYKKIINDNGSDNKLLISHITNDFLKDILSKDKRYKTVPLKKDMRLKALKAKEYIHSVGYWNKYLKYLKERLC